MLATAMKKSTEKLRERVQRLWPAMKGSLAKVYKPCIRKNCGACARGEKHPAWMLSFSEKGRRRCLYVPLDLVPAVRQAIKTGRQLEGLLVQMASAMVKEYRRNRDENPPKAPGNLSKS
jgi:uncharacterized protein DUF6788